MPGINQSNLANILVPNFDSVDLAAVADTYKSRYWAMRFAQVLTEAAKLLVESLIEGQVTESQLIAAQQALEAGDDSLDRAILARRRRGRAPVPEPGPALRPPGARETGD